MTSLPRERVARLIDGVAVHIRPLRPDEREDVRSLYRDSSAWARYLRFFSPVSVDGALRLTPPTSDDAEHCLLAAEVDSQIVGLAQYDVTDDDEIAEVAFMVEDDQQGRGLATLLLEALAERAAGRGIRRFRALFLRENPHMAEVFAHSGFDVRWSYEDSGIGTAEFDLVPDTGWVDAHDRRDRVSQAHSIERLLRPRSIVVIGAGNAERSIGHAIVTNLVAGRFTGLVHPVNHHADDGAAIAGRPMVRSVLDVDGPVDLALVAVPAGAVLDVARECAEKGVRGVVVVSGGFAELPGGAALQSELLDLCHTSGMRLVGPNCVGVINTDPAVSMDATFAPIAPVAGRVGFASQSGGVGIELLARARQLDLGISTFVSMGNKADVSTNDMLQYWTEDPATEVVVLYLESLGNPAKFTRIASELSRSKPVVALKSGRSAPGTRGTHSHTAALADPDTAVDAILRRSGVIRVDTLAELFDVASLLAHQPVPSGKRVAVMSNGGGPAIVAADACVAAGLDVPELSMPVQDALHALAPSGGVANPVDLVATAGPEVFEQASGVLLDSGEIEALLVIHVAPYVTRADEIAAAVARAACNAPRSITIASCYLGLEDQTSTSLLATPDHRVPVFSAPESAARALAHATQLGAWRARPVGAIAHRETHRDAALTRVEQALAESPDGLWASPELSAALLTDYGVPFVESEEAGHANEAVSCARRLGFPVALKATAPDLVHKSDVGGVALDLRDEQSVVDAYESMQTSVGPNLRGVVVQRMADPGLELIIGAHHDPVFGPLVLFGAGGFDAELQHDSIVLVPPLTDIDIDEAMHALRISPLLFGYRNRPAVATDALRDLLARVGQLADDVPELADLDCNPVIVSPEGVVVVDAKVRLAPRPHPPSPFELD